MARTNLAEWPRPSPDTGIGIHVTSKYGATANWAQEMATWNAMGIHWLKMLTGGLSGLDPTRLFVQNGFEVIVRFYHEPICLDAVPTDQLKAFADVGVHYVEGFTNEPEIEWGLAPNDHTITMLAGQHARFADECARAKIIPVTPSIQGDRVHSWFRPFVAKLCEMGRKDALRGSVIGCHNRPGRMPPDSPPIDATLGGPGFVFRSYELFDDVVRDALGYNLPILGTEAGYEPGDVGNDWDKHAAANAAVVGEPWRDALLCQCFWTWLRDWGESGWQGRPVVDVFKAMAKPQRWPKQAAGEVGVHPGFALYEALKREGLTPTTEEFRQGGWVFQVAAGSVALCPEGQWGKVKVVKA